MRTQTIMQRTPSGTIDLVWNGVSLRMEFNCKCLDALPFCKGMCCRRPMGFSVELEADELWKFPHREHPTQKGVFILAVDEKTRACVYLDDETSKCKIHDRKPKMCSRWGCSPGTEKEDAGIERRDAGWALYPYRKEEEEFVQIQLGEK